jgi:hypothetical protein
MKRLWVAIGIGVAVSVAADLVIGRDDPGFMAVFALVGCVLIIVASKGLGKYLLQRRENYYDPRGEG